MNIHQKDKAVYGEDHREPLLTVEDMTDPNLALVTDSQDTQAIKRHIGEEAEDFGGFFVEVVDGDYRQVWGFEGTVPLKKKLVWRVL